MRVSLRPATSEDIPLAMAWRSHPDVYKGMYQQEGPLVWADHWMWWKSRRNWTFTIIEVDDFYSVKRPVGIITVGQTDHWRPEIGIYVGEVTLQGKGVGREALQRILDVLSTRYDRVSSTIKKDNIASLKCFKAVGFKEVCDAREGEVYLECDLKEKGSEASVAEAPHNI